MVYNQNKAKYSLIIFISILFLILLVSNFIEVPFTVKTYSEVFPKEKWLLTRGGTGELVSNVIDFTEGRSSHYNISQFERGEHVSVDFSKYVKNGQKDFNKGDTIVFMKSSDVQSQIVLAAGELDVAMATLTSESTSEKEPLIREAETRLKHTDERIAEQKILYDRAKLLLDKGVSFQQEYETQKWAYDLLLIEKDIYKAQLENLKTGVKPEEIKLLQSQVNSIKTRLKFLKDRESQLLLVSPISGNLITSFTPDTLLNISNLNQIILHVPVKLVDIREFKEGKYHPVTFPGIEFTYTGKVIAVDKEARLLDFQQVVFISMLIENPNHYLLPGMLIESTVEVKKIKLFDYFLRILTV